VSVRTRVVLRAVPSSRRDTPPSRNRVVPVAAGRSEPRARASRTRECKDFANQKLAICKILSCILQVGRLVTKRHERPIATTQRFESLEGSGSGHSHQVPERRQNRRWRSMSCQRRRCLHSRTGVGFACFRNDMPHHDVCLGLTTRRVKSRLQLFHGLRTEQGPCRSSSQATVGTSLLSSLRGDKEIYANMKLDWNFIAKNLAEHLSSLPGCAASCVSTTWHCR